MTNIAIIPARGGSKRIPRKNIKDFLGKPMISYAIKAARDSGLFSRIIVSTEDQEIASVAESFGAEVPRLRPAELADDYTASGDVISSELKWLQSQGLNADYCCCIYATVPLLRSSDLIQCLNKMKEEGKSWGYPLCGYPFPIWRSCKIENGSPKPIWPENMPKRSQDLPEAYHDAGMFYWGTVEAWLTGKPSFWEDFTYPLIIPRHLVMDIDTPEDWHSAELMYQLINSTQAEQ